RVRRRGALSRNAKPPTRGVREPAFRVEAEYLALPLLVSRFQFPDFQIDGGPPAHQVGGVVDDAVNFFRGAFHLPVGDEVVRMGGHGKRSPCPGCPAFAAARPGSFRASRGSVPVARMVIRGITNLVRYRTKIERG